MFTKVQVATSAIILVIRVDKVFMKYLILMEKFNQQLLKKRGRPKFYKLTKKMVLEPWMKLQEIILKME